MAVPIKSNNTQQGCNPISSNCVVWQGPNIPCINLCTGDSVSDVVAKMATELCDITSQTDISLLDLSCFNPLYPTPQNFRDVMQIILNKICALENGTSTDGVNTAGCPSDCEIAVAPCLQYSDNLGNTVTSLPIKDYVILIGNRICTILTSIANLQTQIDALDTRVTNLENGTGGGGGSVSFNVTSDCLSTSSVSLQEYINLLDTAFCELQSNSGTQAQYISASSAAACVTGNSPQIANPSASMAVAGNGNWIGSPTSAFQQIQNLWVTVCDLRAGITTLQEQLNDCCAPDIPCPVNLPAPLISVAKDSPTGDLFFSVTLGGGITTAPSGNIVISGQEWRLARFEGTVIPSATGTPVNISPTIPNPSLSNGPTTYDGGDNRFFTLASIGNSLGVSVFGLFYWENVTTGQQCAVAPSNNNQTIQTLLVSCPALPGSASPNFTLQPTALSITCNAISGSTVTISLTGFPPVTGAGITGTAFVQTNFTYTPFGTTTPITVSHLYSTSNTSKTLTGIACSSTVTMTLVNVTQNSVTRPCTSSTGITIPAPTAPAP
jgi:hypothetical protein